MKWLATTFLLIFTLSCGAQQITQAHYDSLERELPALKAGRRRLFVLNHLFFFYLNKDNKKALQIGTDGLATAEQLKSDTNICIFNDCLGEAYLYMADYKKSLQYLNADYKLAEKMKFKGQMALALSDMSGVYQNQSDNVTSQACSFKALTIYEELKKYRQIAVCDFNIGVIYNNMEDYAKAIAYGRKVLELSNKIPNNDVVPQAYILIGNCYMAKNQTVPESRKYFRQALALFQKSKNDFGVATVLSLLVTVYPNDHQKQIELGLQALQLFKKVAPTNFYAITTLGKVGSAYGEMAIAEKSAVLRKNLFRQSESYLSSALDLATKTNTKTLYIDFADSISIFQDANGKYQDAYRNLRAYTILYDSVYSQDNHNKIASIEGKHEIALRDQELVINKLQIANAQKQRWFLFIGLIAVLLIATSIYYQSIQRKKTNARLYILNAELDEANKVKNRFFSILNHDLRSPVASFVNFLRLQREAPDLIDEATREAYSKKATASAENLLDTMEDLLLWSKGQMENFKPNNRQVPVGLLFEYLQSNIVTPSNIKLIFEGEMKDELTTDEHYVKTIMHNLTNNAIKALKSTVDGVINWKAWRENGHHYLSITDNGPGATESAFKPLYDESAPIGIKNGLGLHIVRDLSKAIGCRLIVDVNRGKGVSITIRFPS